VLIWQHNIWCVYVRSVWRGMPDLIIILIIYVKLLPNKLTHKLHTSKKKHELPEDDQELRPKHVGAIINK